MPVTNHDEGETMSKYDQMREDYNLTNRVWQRQPADTLDMLRLHLLDPGNHADPLVFIVATTTESGDKMLTARVTADTAEQMGLALLEAAAASRAVDRVRRMDAALVRIADQSEAV